MPWQLIYTSAPRGLLCGQSGFCTVARSGDLREALVQRLEQLSSYHYLRVAEAATANRNPTVCAFRILDLRGSKYHVLTRIQPCGLDFTARTNHLAHHLVFQAGELGQLPSPAAILRHWNGWLSAWQGEPRLLEDPALNGIAAASAKSFLPAQTWLRVTGDAGRAAGLLESECIRGCYLVCPRGSEGQVLEMFCETLQLLNLNEQYALRPWRHPFTTFLQAEDNPADFQWRACQEGTPAYQQATQRTTGLIPLRSVRVPNNSLVKVAREGQKPPSPPSAASTQTALTLQRHVPGKKPYGTELSDTGHWRKSIERPEKPPFLDLNFSIHSGSLARIGIFVAVLVGLLVIRYSLSKRHAAQESAPETPPVQVPSTPPSRYGNTQSPTAVEPSAYKTCPPQAAPALDLTQLDGLSDVEPTLLFTAPNLTNFDLPIDSINPFQILISKFDRMDIHPNDIQLSINTDKWDFTSGAPMSLKVRQNVLSATNNSAVECSFDFSDWKNKIPNAVTVTTTLSPLARAFSVHFGFSPATLGDPFRLLIVNESNAPAPLHLPMRWLRINRKGLVASFQSSLGERLKGHFILPNEWHWQLQPFIRTKDESQTNYFYKDLPTLASNELDFVEVQRNLAAQLEFLQETNRALDQNLEAQIKNARLNTPLGKILGLPNESLANFSVWAQGPPTPDRFIRYLHDLKTNGTTSHPEMKQWPALSENDEEGDLADKFHQIYSRCVEQNPDAQSKLMIGNTDYFSFVWKKLKEIEKIRHQKRHVQDEIAKFQQRLQDVPDTVDNMAYVGLFIIDPPRPSLEMIRFQGP